jgi:hypothetical protein
MKIDFPALLKAFEDPTPENQYMIDLQNGSLMKLSLEDALGIKRFQALFAQNPKRFVKVERPSARDNFQELEIFVKGLADPHLKGVLQRALTSHKPFREFRDAIKDKFHARDAWDKFHKQNVEKRANNFLKASGLQA